MLYQIRQQVLEHEHMPKASALQRTTSSTDCHEQLAAVLCMELWHSLSVPAAVCPVNARASLTASLRL